MAGRYDDLRRELLRTRDANGRPTTLFSDPDFPPDKRSLFKDGTPPSSFPYHQNQIVWKRPFDLVTAPQDLVTAQQDLKNAQQDLDDARQDARNANRVLMDALGNLVNARLKLVDALQDLVNKPQFMVEDFNRHDIDQGELGDCWFLAAAAALATSHKHEFERVVPKDQGFEPKRYTGMFRFNFWWYGKWKEVVIDDKLPTVNGRLIYSSNRKSPNEFWPCLLEKAYAKLWGSYEHLHGGKMHDALLDMTGGITEIIDLQPENDVPPNLYSLLRTSHKMKTMMGGSIFSPDISDTRDEMLNGLYRRHAYSITGFKQIPSGNGTANLIRLRNPWGQGEWQGPWSDGSPQMTGLSQQLQDKLKYQERDDGEFWMSFEHFRTIFNELQLCHLQPDAFITELADNDRKQLWSMTVYHGKWIRGRTAGGSGNDPSEINGGDPLPLQTTISQARMMLDLFWKNPQFYLTLESPDTTLSHGGKCTLLVSLMKKGQENESQIGFQIYKLRPLGDTTSVLQKVGQIKFYSSYRQVTQRFELEPGTYAIIPSTFHPHEEASFMLRLFTEKPIDSRALDGMAEKRPLPSKSSKKDKK